MGPGPSALRETCSCGARREIGDVVSGTPLVDAGEVTLAAATRLATRLDTTVLPIQGPPGTGKTYTGARMIVELIREGRRVGIAAQSHKAISNLLEEVSRAAREASVPFRAIQRCETGDEVCDDPSVELAGDNAAVETGLREGRFDLAAGTSWLFSREGMLGAVDALFIDEAGQVSLANVVAMSGCAASIVLLGDPNQLPQVSQGVHPEGAGVSALEHLLGGAATIDEGRGLFLETTWRMHPAINEYISTTFYDGRLDTAPSTALQRVSSSDPLLDGAGIRYVGLVHEGNASSSREEAAVVADAVAGLLGLPWTNGDGVETTIGPEDIIVVAPYNAQVALIHAEIERRLAPGIRMRVGTVDKFQGQEGAIAIYSMASPVATMRHGTWTSCTADTGSTWRCQEPGPSPSWWPARPS
ncbi:MAG: AAA domain-containing protein [Candidatus Limnocylindrales bacterium]